MATKNRDSKDMPWWELVLWLLGMLVVLAGIGWLLWWLGNWVWDCIGNIFDWLFGGSSSPFQSKLERYCAGKYHSTTSALYKMCVDEGWKDWYANAHWMK